ncbi:MAG: hypothetical protein ACK5Z2_02750 [Bacteroidota bacterium]
MKILFWDLQLFSGKADNTKKHKVLPVVLRDWELTIRVIEAKQVDPEWRLEVY